MPDPYQPVPFQVCEQIAKQFAKDIVIVVAVDWTHDKTHFATFGKSADDKAKAAILGDKLGLFVTGSDVQETHQDFRSAKEVAQVKIAAKMLLEACLAAVNRGSHGELDGGISVSHLLNTAIAKAREAGL